MDSLLTAEEERELASRIARGDAEARERLILANLRLVRSIAAKHLGAGLEMADLISEGTIGLMHAADRYDPKRGTRFSTVATWWIRHHIRRAIENKSRIIRIPAHRNGTTHLQQAEEVPDIPAREDTPAELPDDLAAAIAKLPSRQADVIRICVLESMSLAVAAQHLGVSIERTRQIKVKALAKLRVYLSL